MIHNPRRRYPLLLLALSLFPVNSHSIDNQTVGFIIAGTGAAAAGISYLFNNLYARIAILEKNNAMVRTIATKPEIQQMVDVTNDPRFKDALAILPQLKVIWETVNRPAFMQQVAAINDPKLQKALGAFVQAQTTLNDILRDPKNVSAKTLLPSFTLFVERFKDLSGKFGEFEQRVERQLDKAEKRIDAGLEKISSAADQIHSLRTEINTLREKLKVLEAAQNKQANSLQNANADVIALNSTLTKVASSCDARLAKLEADAAPRNMPQPSAPPAYS